MRKQSKTRISKDKQKLKSVYTLSNRDFCPESVNKFSKTYVWVEAELHEMKSGKNRSDKHCFLNLRNSQDPVPGNIENTLYKIALNTSLSFFYNFRQSSIEYHQFRFDSSVNNKFSNVNILQSSHRRVVKVVRVCEP